MTEETVKRLIELLRHESIVGADGCLDVAYAYPPSARLGQGVGILLRYGIEEGGNAETGPQIYPVAESWVELFFEPDSAGHLGKWTLDVYSGAQDDPVPPDDGECFRYVDPPVARIELTRMTGQDVSLERVAQEVGFVLRSLVPAVVNTCRDPYQDLACDCGGDCGCSR